MPDIVNDEVSDMVDDEVPSVAENKEPAAVEDKVAAIAEDDMPALSEDKVLGVVEVEVPTITKDEVPTTMKKISVVDRNSDDDKKAYITMKEVDTKKITAAEVNQRNTSKSCEELSAADKAISERNSIGVYHKDNDYAKKKMRSASVRDLADKSVWDLIYE